jgi:peptidoglycan/xylan/chitin deacetylase (PgdA/CDA1 family)
VYLTFDDGPSPPWTGQVLDVLKRYNAKATFFVVGSEFAVHQQLATRIACEGHALGNHTYHHRDLTRLSDVELLAELDATQVLILRLTGSTTHWMRPPYGFINAHVRALVAERGYHIAHWNVDPQDWRRPGVSPIVDNVLGNTVDEDIILLHDGGGDRSQTVVALERVLAILGARGYAFYPLPMTSPSSQGRRRNMARKLDRQLRHRPW